MQAFFKIDAVITCNIASIFVQCYRVAESSLMPYLLPFH